MLYKITKCSRCQLTFVVIPKCDWREDKFCTYECQNGLPSKKESYTPKNKRRLKG
jgi:hypothetical protein